MDNVSLLFRACIWSILLGVIADLRKLRLRGLGFSEVRPLRILGSAVVVAALLFAFESPGSFDVAEVIRGGAAVDSAIKKENPAFRIRRYDGTKARVLFEALRGEFKDKGPFTIKQGGSEKTLTGERILEMATKWLEKWRIDLRSSDEIPITPLYVTRIIALRKELEDRQAARDRHGRLDHRRGTLGFQWIVTQTGQPFEVAEDDVTDYRRTVDFMRDNITVVDTAGTRKTLTIDQLYEMVDEMMMQEKVEVYNEFEDKYEALDQAGLKKLLDYESRTQVNWEKEWFAISEDFFDFMKLRFEQAKSSDGNPRPLPPSLKQFAAPANFDPLKLNRDGLFLVTPSMEIMEQKRPVFVVSYFHIRGLCAKGWTDFGIQCEEPLRESELSFSIRGLTDADAEVDEIHFPNSELAMLPLDLERKYASDEVYKKVKEELREEFFVQLIPNDTSYLTCRFLARAKYLQQYAEVRDYLPWLQKTLALADEINFDENMKGFTTAHDIAGTDQQILKQDLVAYMLNNGLGIPMLTCREAAGVSGLRTLMAISVCLSRTYEIVNCESEGNCENKFHWVTPNP